MSIEKAQGEIWGFERKNTRCGDGKEVGLGNSASIGQVACWGNREKLEVNLGSVKA